MGAVAGSVLGMLIAAAALAADGPEAVYAKLHRATLQGDVQAVLDHATAARRAQMAPLPGKEDMVRMMAMSLPQTYSITSTTVSPNGRSALLRARGVHEKLGPAQATVQLFREDGEWKVDEWSWAELVAAEREPAMVRVQASATPPPPKPAAPEEEKPAAAVEVPTLRKASDKDKPCVIKPVMSDEDLRRCGATPPKY